MLFTIFLLLFGVLVIGLGIFAIKKPTSWFFRPIGLQRDSEPSAGFIDYIKFAGVITIVLGVIFLIFGILSLL
ncbi:hypothetical protein EHV15_28580 [Paenibacillus oralis]|uniref:DUF6199 domain-containing protein n=1 Tax=Paenibacillus oralis TaxID=2490856 RepID=A0A3P3UA52_9BACL|nr:hypothetical protein [Paenibacillus oralis]RRJ66439.1 hypothetical protein EHV15_28580 [Paenibacillus oralis]